METSNVIAFVSRRIVFWNQKLKGQIVSVPTLLKQLLTVILDEQVCLGRTTFEIVGSYVFQRREGDAESVRFYSKSG